MIASDETALICDLAETYGITGDYRALPLRTLAALASGLRDNSRSKMKLSGIPVERDTLLLAMGVDALNQLVWSRTKAAQSGRNRPKSIAEALLYPQKEDKIQSFRTGADFERARAMIEKKVKAYEH